MNSTQSPRLTASQIHQLASLSPALRQSFLTLRTLGFSPARAFLFVTC